MSKALTQRLTIAIPTVALFLYAIFKQPKVFFVLISLVLLRTLWEFYNLYKEKIGSFSKTALFLSAIFHYVSWNTEGLTEAMTILSFLFFFALQFFDKKNVGGMEKIALTSCGFFYITVLGSYIFKLYHLKPEVSLWGATMVFWVIFICKFSDATAYFGGVCFGKHKMIPRISPNKSWEGFFFGLLGGLVPVFFIAGMDGFTYLSAFMFCLIVTLFAVAGDFIESMLKRELNVKDAANDIPVFGGTFDMIDSVVTSLPIAYCFIHFLKIA